MNQVQQPQMLIPPVPLPCTFTLEQLTAGGQPVIRLQVHTPAGVTVGYMAPADAEQFGENLARMAKAMKSGLIVPVTQLRPAQKQDLSDIPTLGMTDEEIAEREARADNVRPFQPMSLGQE